MVIIMDIKLVNIEIEGLILQVDEETANAIENDSSLAARYVAMARQHLSQDTPRDLPSTQDQPKQCNLWKSAKNPTEQDHKATVAFLILRKQFDKEFADKKTSKNIIWGKIVTAMNEMGYYVGEGAEGREKCRQKFANMQNAYMRTLDKRRQTGEGHIRNPPYFDELNDILGDKHKVQPVFLLDSTFGEKKENKCKSKEKSVVDFHSDTSDNTNAIYGASTSKINNNCDASSPQSTSGVESSIANTPTTSNNRFNNIKKSVRPRKDSVLETIKNINDRNQENRRAEFQELLNLMKVQNERRHEQIMALISNMTPKINKGKKRSRSSSDEN